MTLPLPSLYNMYKYSAKSIARNGFNNGFHRQQINLVRLFDDSSIVFDANSKNISRNWDGKRQHRMIRDSQNMTGIIYDEQMMQQNILL